MTSNEFELESVKSIPLDLVPTQKHKNDFSRAVLNESGDDGTILREVSHIFVKSDMPDAIDGRDIVDMYLETGFLVSSSDQYDLVKVSHQTEVASAKFDDFTEATSKFLESVGWVYDGWTTLIVKPNTLQ